MGRRGLLVVLAVVALASAVALFLVRRKSPPRAAELLPPSQGVLYIDVDLLRKGGVFDHSHPIQRDPEFEQFVRESGFDFERDLDEVAFAIHNPVNFAHGDDYPRFSEILIGRVDVNRASAYLKKLSASTEQYGNETIFNIPHDGRTVRVAVLDEHLAAASNTEDVNAIHSMIDAYGGKAAEHPSLARFYPQVPLGSIAWFIGDVAPPIGSSPAVPQGLMSPSWLRDIAAGSTVVASVRFLTQLEVRIVANAPSEAAATRIAQSASSWLAVFRTLQQSAGVSGSDVDVKAAIDSLKVEQQRERVVLRADVPAAVLKKIAAEPPAMSSPAPTPAAPSTAPKAEKKGAKKK